MANDDFLTLVGALLSLEFSALALNVPWNATEMTFDSFVRKVVYGFLAPSVSVSGVLSTLTV
jgi:hypothetical protein